MNDLADAIRAQPDRFALHQLLRLLRAIDPPGASPRLRGRTSMDWPAADVDTVEPRAGGGHTVTTASGVLAGATGVMPNPFRQAVAEAVAQQEENGLVELLGLFEGRLGELEQAVWESGSLAAQEERDDPGAVSLALDALNGLDCPAARQPDLRGFATLLQPMTRGHAGFADLVAELLGVPAVAEAFHPRWLPVPAVARLRLGQGGRSVGRQTWDRASAIRLVLGPCGPSLAVALLEAPPGVAPPLQAGLAGLATHYLPNGLAVRLMVALTPEATPTLRLGRSGQALTPRIGRTAWIGPRPVASAVVAFWLSSAAGA